MNDKQINIKDTKYNNRIFNILKVSKNNFTNTSSNDSIIKKISEKKKKRNQIKFATIVIVLFIQSLINADMSIKYI